MKIELITFSQDDKRVSAEYNRKEQNITEYYRISQNIREYERK